MSLSTALFRSFRMKGSEVRTIVSIAFVGGIAVATVLAYNELRRWFPQLPALLSPGLPLGPPVGRV